VLEVGAGDDHLRSEHERGGDGRVGAAGCKPAVPACIVSETHPDLDDAGDDIEEPHDELATPIKAKPNRALTRVESNERAKRAREAHVEVQRRVRPHQEDVPPTPWAFGRTRASPDAGPPTPRIYFPAPQIDLPPLASRLTQVRTSTNRG